MISTPLCPVYICDVCCSFPLSFSSSFSSSFSFSFSFPSIDTSSCSHPLFVRGNGGAVRCGALRCGAFFKDPLSLFVPHFLFLGLASCRLSESVLRCVARRRTSYAAKHRRKAEKSATKHGSALRFRRHDTAKERCEAKRRRARVTQRVRVYIRACLCVVVKGSGDLNVETDVGTDVDVTVLCMRTETCALAYVDGCAYVRQCRCDCL